MSVFCACGTSSKNPNTGVSSAILRPARTFGHFYVRRFSDDGTKNQILASDFVNGVLPASYIAEKLNHIDPSKRWYPVQDLRSITDERDAPNTQDFDGGQNSIITSEGVRNFSGLKIDGNAKYKDNLDKLSCEQLAVFIIDECGALIGETEKGNEEILIPLAIAKRNFYVLKQNPTGTDGQTLNITFQYDQLVQDGKECLVPANALETNLKDVDGLLNLCSTISAISTTGFTTALTLEYGGFVTKKPVTGLVTGDFTIFNTTTKSAVTIDTFTDNGGGSYTFGFVAQTSTDILELRQADNGTKYTKEGFELEKTLITIP